MLVLSKKDISGKRNIWQIKDIPGKKRQKA